VHWTLEEHRDYSGGSLRVFGQFAWLEVGSVKMALSRPTHQRVTHTVGQRFLHNYVAFLLCFALAGQSDRSYLKLGKKENKMTNHYDAIIVGDELRVPVWLCTSQNKISRFC